MDTELDVNKVAAEFLQANIESAWSLVKSRAKGARNLVRVKFERTYQSYLERLLERYSRGKSFFIRSEQVPLYEFFVPLDLATPRRTLNKPSSANLAAVSPCSILSGSGGSGKTMMMRHLLITTITERSKTPIFLELRHLNQGQEGIRSALLQNLVTNGLDVDDEYLEVALDAGHFCIMLDGFDELQHSRRKAVSKEIQELALRYPKNWFVMSSRPDIELEGWGPFIQYRVQPLDLERAVELVIKLPFDAAITEKFVADLRRNLFARHRSFLSNPLLLSIMLLTYSDNAHIPNKLSVFYSQAYESLFHKHDALKGGFQRERRSGLDIQDFGRAFAAFCIQSYDARLFAFSQSRALEILEAGKKMTQLTYEPRAILDDALQAVCLLVEDGMEITFSHRSFQEYFAARFINSCPSELKSKLVERIKPSTASDVVMALLYEMDPYTVEKLYILPAIENLRKQIKASDKIGVTLFLRFIRCMFSGFSYDAGTKNVAAMIGDQAVFSAVRFAAERCAELSETSQKSKERFQTEQKTVTAAFVDEFGTQGSIVPTTAMTTRNKFTRVLFATHSGIWGGTFLREILSIDGPIRKRHQETQSSIEALFEPRKL